MKYLSCFIFLALFFFTSCTEKDIPQNSQYALEGSIPHLEFTQPVDLQDARDGSNRLYVVEQQGIIYGFENDSKTQERKVFLDIHERVRSQNEEEGLLGLAFHPHYKDNGYFYVDYMADKPLRTVISRFKRSINDPQKADPNSELIILEVEQPYINHNGGQVAFGPDGYLYISFGDGGAGGDPYNNGQSLKILLGKILRIDVDHPQLGKNYGIPSDNPFVGHSEALGEIYAFGLRNPWRFSFDPVTKKMWVADVGQNRLEEIDIVDKGKNYGWNIMEGKSCFNPSTNCNEEGLVLPIWDYPRDEGKCVTGGFVYRGKKFPELVGQYIYGDFVSGRLWKMKYDFKHPPVNELMVYAPNLFPSSFGIDKNNEIYICSYSGQIFQLKRKE